MYSYILDCKILYLSSIDTCMDNDWHLFIDIYLHS